MPHILYFTPLHDGQASTPGVGKSSGNVEVRCTQGVRPQKWRRTAFTREEDVLSKQGVTRQESVSLSGAEALSARMSFPTIFDKISCHPTITPVPSGIPYGTLCCRTLIRPPHGDPSLRTPQPQTTVRSTQTRPRSGVPGGTPSNRGPRSDPTPQGTRINPTAE